MRIYINLNFGALQYLFVILLIFFNIAKSFRNSTVIHCMIYSFNYYFFNWLGTGVSYNYLEQVGHFEDDAPDQRLYAHRVSLRLALTSPRPDWLRF